MKKNLRRQQVLKRRNFLPTLSITVILWLALGGLIYFVDPDSFAVIPLFFILAFFCLLFAFSLIFANSRRGVVATIALSFFLLLMYFGVGNILNLILIVAIALSIELYFSLR
ncbi:hypothetical protein A2394_02075 [Candidatus Woesebacteria bacterium RIFOXYB1_FULL_42_36]|uniref:Uncharacterized protein n=1 Tax=Candidatus Woesebacteria bacterium RIFOXYD1_FULL_43_18 TaxID=1802551 RepID=A0A1F8DJ98_9BACT|nr:MAG: hypothetical protein A2208_02200 [Candidatus Woesebacteria bacterium RIFOXYA1_FULL_43_16]OGM81584.1 MAG: hypothetical protein A2394_02075 [Candidatus Woesebacteria bacterium RIFOXYB1_FULL_42_36]OGM83671.1 MAG: hypothetical protein A2421_02305 [Candidatus Woesebacteria bacterium RIFOXYC1_FULL_43_18]OGM87865.1 MAG: hypothetical protein A2573_01515 [Candidatus Woesebacteria bacterium RIFOXYD1_FULL_43_18]